MAMLQIKSDITGSVWKILVQKGQNLAAGETLMILESMKMEIQVIAEDGGTIVEVHVAEGDSVSEGQLLASLSE